MGALNCTQRCIVDEVSFRREDCKLVDINLKVAVLRYRTSIEESEFEDPPLFEIKSVYMDKKAMGYIFYYFQQYSRVFSGSKKKMAGIRFSDLEIQDQEVAGLLVGFLHRYHSSLKLLRMENQFEIKSSLMNREMHKFRHIERLWMTRMELAGREVADSFEALCKHDRLEEIRLESCMFDQDFLNGLTNGLKHLKWLRSFWVSGTGSAGLNDLQLQMIVDVMIHSHVKESVKSLCLPSHAWTPSSLSTLTRLLSNMTNIKRLTLSNNESLFLGVTSDSPAFLEFLEAVEEHPSLKSLVLSKCGITDDLASPIFRAISQKPNMRLRLYSPRHTLEDSIIEHIPEMKHLLHLQANMNLENQNVQQALFRNTSLVTIQQGSENNSQFLDEQDLVQPRESTAIDTRLADVTMRNKLLHGVQQESHRSEDTAAMPRALWPMCLHKAGQPLDQSAVFAFLTGNCDQLVTTEQEHIHLGSKDWSRWLQLQIRKDCS